MLKRTTNAVLALLVAVSVGGCYWTPGAAAGRVSFSVTSARPIVANPTDYTLRVYLYDADAVSAEYLDWSGFPTTNPIDYAYLTLAITGSPIPLDGHDYWEVDLGANPPTNGTLVIPDVVAGRKYRLVVQWWYHGFPPPYADYQGVSNIFEVPDGGVASIAVSLYQLYMPY